MIIIKLIDYFTLVRVKVRKGFILANKVDILAKAQSSVSRSIATDEAAR